MILIAMSVFCIIYEHNMVIMFLSFNWYFCADDDDYADGQRHGSTLTADDLKMVGGKLEQVFI